MPRSKIYEGSKTKMGQILCVKKVPFRKSGHIFRLCKGVTVSVLSLKSIQIHFCGIPAT